MGDMVRRWLVRAYHSDRWIPVLSVVAVLSLVGTMVLFVLYAIDQSAERNRARQADRGLCLFANDLRDDVRAIGRAGEDMVQGIVDVVLPADATNGERAAAILRIREQLEPVFNEHRDAVGEIENIDCRSVTGTASREYP